MYRLSRIMTLLVIIILPFSLGCEGPQGPDGSQGPQGPEGPVGPAGEDGSVMYSGQGGPGADIGDNGDYYLNQNTGELYGPKDSDGWGNPIIVLMGEDGTDGEDGEDGSQIHSGSGAPDASLGVVGDFYFDESSGEFYGPKTENGWGSPTDLTGADGQDGEDGEDGEDGSQIHSGSGAPDASLGVVGDFYFDESSGEFYGPKTENGWGSPTDLTGADGQDGEDGEDGEDGSQIHSGSGAPDASLGVVGDFYLDEANYDLYGPKTDSGWGSPLNLKGADGNANVTRYIYPEHDFQDDANGGDGHRAQGCIEGISEEEIPENPLNYYLVAPAGIIYSVPGYGSNGSSMYKAYAQHSTMTCNDGLLWRIDREDGDGEEYDRIEIVRIEASNTEDNRKAKDAIIPDHLDFSDYEAVAEYYNFYSE